MDKWVYDHKAVGERIRQRRKELNLTQSEFAEKVERVPKYCADIERGYCGMSIDTLLAFCHALRISPSTLLLGDAIPSQDDSDVTSKIMAGLSECSAEQKESVLQTIRLFTKHR